MIPPMIPLPEVSSDANNISEAVRSLSIADIKDHPSIYLDHDVQGLVAGFVKAKLDAAKGKRCYCFEQPCSISCNMLIKCQ